VEIQFSNPSSSMVVRDCPFNRNEVASIRIEDMEGNSTAVWLSKDQASQLAEALIAMVLVKKSMD